MNILLVILIGIISSVIWGVVLYVVALEAMPERYSQKLFALIPLYPRTKYAVILYVLSGILYPFVSVFVAVLGAPDKGTIIISALICVIASAQMVRLLARWRKETVEELYEEEMERKRWDRFR